ncbi:MAG: SGNH/GDSL hydrolase family protein [Deltaproteobacteria bacterium]
MALSCRNQPAESPGISAETDTAMLKILALGDSYTIGQGVAHEDSYPALLARELKSEGLSVSPPLIIARTGWTTENLRAAISSASLAPPYDLVLLLIGVNNQFQGYSAESYAPEFDILLAKSIALTGGNPSRVIVISIPDYGATPLGRRLGGAKIGAAIDQFNAINRAASGRNGVAYVDVTGISRKAEGDSALIASDGLHPSQKMYSEWVDVIAPAALEILK